MITSENADAANVGAHETTDPNQGDYTRQSDGPQSQSWPLIVRNFSEFMAAQFESGEVIAFDICRRELGLIASVTNAGKSTLIRNASLALATGHEFAPVVPLGSPRRVLVVDFESSASRLQSDLAKMTRGWSEQRLALLRENLFVVCEGMIGDDLLSLSKHMQLIERLALERKVDLIVVDTACAGFDLWDENSNSEVARCVLKPLLKLARRLNCAVIMLHHIGKARSEEGQAKETVHKPRGASSFAGYAASVFVLGADDHDPNAVTLSCAKRKSGENYRHTLMLNRETRWFVSVGVVERGPTDYDLVLWVVLGTDGEVKRCAINAALQGKVTERTITRCLARAVKRGEMISPKKGFYSVNYGKGNGQSATAI